MSIGLAHAQELAAPPAPASSELQTQVEALLESGPFEIHGAHIAYPSVIYEFYAQRGFHPAWTNARHRQRIAARFERQRGRRARSARLSPARSRGTRRRPPIRAAIPRPTRSCTPMRCCASPITSCSARWMPPRSTRIGTTRAAPSASTSRSESKRAVASDDIYAEIEKLKPTHRMYLPLKQELARYRQAAAGTERDHHRAGQVDRAGHAR